MPRTRLGLLLSLVAVLALAGCARPAEPLPPAPPFAAEALQPVSLPRDALPHDVLTEWWYYTGHLQTASGEEYGFEFTIFQARRVGAPTGYLAHFAVSDIARQQFSHQARGTQGEAQLGYPLEVDGWRLESTADGETIEARMAPGGATDVPYDLRLRLVDVKPPALHHDGYIDFGAAGGSYYYSRTRIAAEGTLNGEPVTGQAWMDHQWGNFVVAGGGGWDWFSLQLDDRSELMLYVIRGARQEILALYGTRVLPDGSVEEIGPAGVSVEASGQWSSPHTGGVYPSGWRLGLPGGETLILTPRILDQELYEVIAGATAPYWEGAVLVTGDRTGLGYVELTGYIEQ